MNSGPQNDKWCDNLIIVDADYLDKLTFDLTVNFERIIGRRIPKADLARWIDCIALDGGIREGENTIQVIFIHGKDRKQLENFIPGSYVDDISGKAFKDHLGEFMLGAYPVEEMVSTEDYFVQTVELACSQPEVKRVMLIPGENTPIYQQLRPLLSRLNGDKQVTLFSMQPLEGGKFFQEILGYSLLNALGIRADEIKE